MSPFNVGDKASLVKQIEASHITAFAELSMDSNPAHLDEVFAAKSIFRKPVAHGLYVSSFISAVIGTKLPGAGCVYMSQDLKFISPVYINDTITAEVEVIDVDRKGKLTLSTKCINQHNEVVIDGKAVVKPVPLKNSAT